MYTESIDVELVDRNEKSILRNLMQAYRHDLSEFDGSLPEANGFYSLGNHFEDYWIESNRFPYKILVNSQIAGYALVRKVAPRVHSIAEFFVPRPYRKNGIGKRAAYLIFDLHPGEWQIAQDEENTPAQKFGKKIIGELTRDAYKNEWSDSHPRDPMQVFTNEGV